MLGWRGLGILTHAACPQNIMPLSAAMFLSECKNPTPQCPPRLEVQMLMPISWSRMPNRFLQVETRRAGERLGWAVQCQEPLTMMALHIPEENRSGPALSRWWDWGGYFCKPSGVWVQLSATPSLPQDFRQHPRSPQITPQGALDPSQWTPDPPQATLVLCLPQLIMNIWTTDNILGSPDSLHRAPNPYKGDQTHIEEPT